MQIIRNISFKHNFRKLFAVALSFVISASGAVLPIYAEGEDATNNTYFCFEEDFLSYDETNAHIGSSMDDGYYHYNGAKVLAERSDGAKWVTSELWYGGVASPNGQNGVTVKGASYIDPDNNRMATRAYGDIYPAITKLDIAGLYSPEQAGAIQQITFKTGSGAKIHGMALYMSEDEKNFYVFGKVTGDTTRLAASYLPFVGQYTNGVCTLINQATDVDTWKPEASKSVTWTVKVIGDKVTYKCVSENGVVWNGTFNDTDGYTKNYKYLGGQFTAGDSQNFLYNFKFETGNYYSGGMGEPVQVLYKNIAEGKQSVESEGVYTVEFSKSYPVRRVKARALGKGGEFSLSEDGENWDTFALDNSYVWLNCENDKNYKYLRASREPVGRYGLYVFTECADNEEIIVGKNETTGVYLYVDSIEQVDTLWEVADERYATISADGKIRGVKDGTTQMSTDVSGEIVKITVICKGAMTQALESGDSAVIADYVETQQNIINNLNTAIQEKDTVKINQFMTAENDNSLYNIDAMTSLPEEIKSADTYSLDMFCQRLTTYTGDFAVESIEDITALEKILIRELRVNELCNKATVEELKTAIKDNNSELGLPVDTDYYKEYTDKILVSLLNTEFENYDDLYETLVESVIFVNIKESINPEYLVNLCGEYADVIGYDETKFDSITDKTLFGGYLVENKAGVTDIDTLRQFIDGYTPAVTPTATPRPVYGGGGGGGDGFSSGGSKGGSPVVLLPAASAVPEKTNDDTVVEKRLLFSDVPIEAWEYEAVRFLNAKNAVSGYEDGTFRSNNNITRAEFVKILITAFGIPTEDETNTENTEITEETAEPAVFADITESDWYFKHMVKANELGLLKGSDGKCYPQRYITKQEIAAVILRALDYANKSLRNDTEIFVFEDSEEIADWALEAVNKLQASGIVKGDDGRFFPNDNATRAEAAQLLYGALRKTEGGGVTE